MGKADAALPTLNHWLQLEGAPFFALQAANVLDRIGESARPSLPTIKKLLESSAKEAGSNSPRAYSQRILERVADVLEGRQKALVYPTFDKQR